MNKIHRKLNKQFTWYQKWHSHPYHSHLHWLCFINAFFIVLITLLFQIELSFEPVEFKVSVPQLQAQTICQVGPATGNDTAQIQQAINNCAGGGEVRLRSGQIYIAGTIEIKSGVTLNLNNATLQASENPDDFTGLRCPTCYPVFIGTKSGAENVKIIGPGTIKKTAVNSDKGANMVEFYRTDGIEVRNLVIDSLRVQSGVDSAGMHLRTSECRNVLVEDVEIRGNRNIGGSDGIAIISTDNAVVRRCKVDVYDDGLYARGASHNVLIEDCDVSSRAASGLLVGGGRGENSSDITYRNITIHDSNGGQMYGAIKFKLRDVGVFERFTFKNITIGPNIRNFIIGEDFNYCYEAGPCYPPEEANQVDSLVRDICFEDITVKDGAGKDSKIIGDGDTRVENLIFSNVKFEGGSGSKPYLKFVNVNGLTLSRSGSASDYGFDNVSGLNVTNTAMSCGEAPPPSCTCTSWQNDQCGGGSCLPTKMRQIGTNCTPSGCFLERCVDDSACALQTACNDGSDNDGDTLIDYPADPGCTSAQDNDETDPTIPFEDIDLNCDNIINIKEFGILLSHWEKTGTAITEYHNNNCCSLNERCPASIDISQKGLSAGTIDAQDISIIFSNWGRTQ